MTALTGRRIVLGVCGGIAAYKAVEVCRRLVDAGAHVVPVMTNGATKFVGELTFSALASEPVQRSLYAADRPIPHTQLGQTADLILVAPATARLLSAYRMGYSHDLLTNTLIATRAPVMVAPAMHTEMWEHPAVQDNMSVLQDRGVLVVPPGVGRLAGGDVGAGRLAEPEDIVAAVIDHFATAHQSTTASESTGSSTQSTPSILAGKRVLISAGGTREPIDPVRFIANRSSGKQGHALADEAAKLGAQVVLVTTVPETAPNGVTVYAVDTAHEMHQAIMKEADAADIIIMAAAIADFRPETIAPDKIKKHDGVPEIRLTPTVDVLAELGSKRRAGQTLVGFAAETRNAIEHGEQKLRAKGADMIVVNNVADPGAGFSGDTNEVVILTVTGQQYSFSLASKAQIAQSILQTAGEFHLQHGEAARGTGSGSANN